MAYFLCSLRKVMRNVTFAIYEEKVHVVIVTYPANTYRIIYLEHLIVAPLVFVLVYCLLLFVGYAYVSIMQGYHYLVFAC